MAEMFDVLKLCNGKRRKITRSEPLFPTLVTFGAGTLPDENDEEPDFSYFDPSDDEDSDSICLRLTTDQIFGEDHEDAVQISRDRYLRSSCNETSHSTSAEFEAAKFEWAYAVTEGPDFPPAPIWAIKVTRGREWDVVCTILEIAQRPSEDYDILSACATPATPGIVYIECTSESVVQRILSCVAFTRRTVAPRQLSLEEFRCAIISSVQPVREGSWVRIESTGQYQRDLAWVQRYDEETCSALIYIVPRWLPNQPFHGDVITKTNVEQLNGSLDDAAHCHLYGQSFHFGFLLRRELLAHLDVHHVIPSTVELELWTQSTMYHFVDHVSREGIDPDVIQTAALFAHSIKQQLAAAENSLPLQIGHRVRLIDQDGDGGNLTSLRWSAAQTILDLRVGDRVTVTKGPWGGLRATVTKINLLEAEVDISCDARSMDQFTGAEAPHSNKNVIHHFTSHVNKRRLSAAARPRFSSITLPWENVRVNPKCVMFQQAIALSTSGPSPHHPYIQLEVKAFDRNIGMFYGTILSTSADRSLVTVRTEGRAVNTIELMPVKNVTERHTGLALAEYVHMPLFKIRELRAQREKDRSAVADKGQSEKFAGLGDACEAWPEVFASTEPTTGSDLLSSTTGPSLISTDTKASAVPLDWLLQSALEKCYLDVIVRGGTTKISAEYDKRVGVIRSMEKVKRGKRGSVKIRFGRGGCTDRWIPVRNVFPLTTTEFEGVTTSALAKPILDVMGIYVVIIGPDAAGRRTFVGRTGFTSWEGKVNVDGALIVFPVTSLCRSDPVAK
ncbi:hypothetical protein R3P38DRAFT_3235932 [Favolaschia claudopus]|uniref:NGN domain-containing protein n=1 Tax=Favolaschia claudopus TaxID=2862362 RepID=A0AAV9ZDD1_9AGAR